MLYDYDTIKEYNFNIINKLLKEIIEYIIMTKNIRMNNEFIRFIYDRDNIINNIISYINNKNNIHIDTNYLFKFIYNYNREDLNIDVFNNKIIKLLNHIEKQKTTKRKLDINNK